MRRLKKPEICEIIGGLGLILAGIFSLDRDIYYMHGSAAIIIFTFFTLAIVFEIKSRRSKFLILISLATIIFFFGFLNTIFEWIAMSIYFYYFYKKYGKKDLKSDFF